MCKLTTSRCVQLDKKSDPFACEKTGTRALERLLLVKGTDRHLVASELKVLVFGHCRALIAQYSGASLCIIAKEVDHRHYQ